MVLQNKDSQLILASTSSTRQRLLSAAGLTFEVMAPEVDEPGIREALRNEGIDTAAAAIALADAKARNVIDLLDRPAVVLAADQLLEFDGDWLEKPQTLEACRAHLRRLRGSEHRLLSGVVAYQDGSKCWEHCGQVSVRMREFSDEFLETYLDAVDPSAFNSVGGYQLEDLGAHLMHRVDGDYFTVLGLPVIAILQFLRAHNLVEE